ncbi:TlpA disulfide reductase family protein [Microbacterium sp. Marseille-Q6648]|uniref:TlpA family protein disulfide reductase n=1 Tax=Microbacterium sp. Marseille-Q6648 TaxID=2937991 RepID=UPI00203C189E|nr:TlpA disulfide reductase family protein [Microbacterium sp. Marseille-Q6648]
MLAVTAVLAVAGCTSQDGLAATVNNGTGSASVDERIVEIPETERSETVAFAGIDERGNPVSNDDFAGEVYVVNFWYAACGPCRVEAPLLEEVWRTYQPEGVGFIGVNIYDQPATALSFAEDYGITYPSVIDIVDGKTKLAFAAVTPIQATPTTLVMDRQGRVAARIIGQLPAASILSTLVADALAENE